ncbi:hypothetical protein N2152v2_010669 [Parachlorella kessleri]
MLSTTRLMNLDEDLGAERDKISFTRSLFARAERNMLEKLPARFTGFRGGLTGKEAQQQQQKKTAVEQQESHSSSQESIGTAGGGKPTALAEAAIATEAGKQAEGAGSRGAVVDAGAGREAAAQQQPQQQEQEQPAAAADGQVSGTAGAAEGVVAGIQQPLSSTTFLQPQNEELALQTSDVVKASRQCRMTRNQDSWGDNLVWGPNNKKDTAEQCCQSCADYQPVPETEMLECNVWVFCEDPHLCGGEYKECWLKHRGQPSGANPAPRGPLVGWTTGIMSEPDFSPAPSPDPDDDRRYHVVITAQGNGGMHWGSRVGYYWFKKIKAQCEAEGNCHMGGFTRILHDGQPDDLMAEIPTFVAQPLPPEHADLGYVVLNRPYAILQWVQQASIPEKYVLMSEPDHIWLKPMPNLMKGQRPAAFPFFYIEPWSKANINITAKFVGPLTRAEAEKIPPIGNAPTLLSLEDMKRLMPVWFNLSIAVHTDPVSNKEWGWVQEMYAFTLSCWNLGLREIDLHRWMMAQPPYDSELDRFYILHYTYSNEFGADGEFTWMKPEVEVAWKWNKRDFYTQPVPRNLIEPPPNVKNEMARWLIRAINEATHRIPGWDEYAQTGKATQVWDGTF